nr:uncharacterized protein LOC119159683 [Rhipicephalus microplus]
MLKFCILVLATVSYVSPGTITEANAFVDTIINEDVPLLVKESPRLYPYATIEDFSFTVPQNRVTNRDLTVNMTRGKVRGLDTAVQRKEDCEALFLRTDRLSLSATLPYRESGINFTSLAKGDNIVGVWKTIQVNVSVTNGTIQFEAKVPPGRPRRHSARVLHQRPSAQRHIRQQFDPQRGTKREIQGRSLG